MRNTHQLIRQWMQQDGIVILLYMLTLVIMTYPLVFKLNEIIPFHNGDTYTAMWQNWWIHESLINGYDINFTSLLFYPNGLDITLQPRRWTSYPLWAIYNGLFGEPTAYNLTVLTQTLLKAYAMYRLILLFIPHRPSAWIGGAFFAFSARVLSQGIQQPNTGSLEFIPIFMIVFVIALRRIASEDKDRSSSRLIVGLMLLASVAFSANVYMNIKIGIFAMFIGGAYIFWIFVIQRLWRNPRFWYGITAFGIASLVLSALILIPTLTYEGLGEAINQVESEVNEAVDLLTYIKPSAQAPLFLNQFIASFNDSIVVQSKTNGLGQVGFISIVLATTGAIYMLRKNWQHLIWVILLVNFLLLSFGSTITVGLENYPEIWMPYRLVQHNVLFVALRSPARFQILMIFAQSILIAFGIHRLYMRTSRMRHFQWIMIGITMLMLFEISVFPIPYSSAEHSDVYDYVAEHPGPLITMPLGSRPAKYAMYNQMLHGQPILEGKIARTPEDAYDFIKNNRLLSEMSQITEIQQVSDTLLENWNTEINKLLNAGFRYVVVHRLVDTGRHLFVVYPYQERMFFMEIEPDYETDTEAVYDLQKLRDNPPQGDPFADE